LRRLQRLVRAQFELLRLLEAGIAAERRREDELGQTRADTLAASERISKEGLAFYAATLRRLAELDRSMAGSRAARRELFARLLSVRGRQEASQRRLDTLLEAHNRKMLMEETTETVLTLQEKATGKRGVVK